MTATLQLPLIDTLSPADESNIAEAVREAGAVGRAVYPLGGRTSLDYGLPPVKLGVGLSTARLDRIIDYRPNDFTVTVEAGVTVAALARTLAERAQRLPVDIRSAERATLGGALAVAAAGPRRCGCGTLADYLVGFRAVDGRGTIFTHGGRVLKNVPGYNLCRLMVGSLGTLGVLTEATFAVRPMPDSSVMAACDLPDLAAAEPLLAALVRSRTQPAAVELLAVPPPLGQSLRELAPGGNQVRLVVGFEGSQAEVDWMIERLLDEWRHLGVSSLSTAAGPDAQRWWAWLIDFAPTVEVGVLPGAVVAMMTALRAMAPEAALQAHAGDGVIGIKMPAEMSPEAFCRLLVERMRPAVADAGGRLAVISPPAGAALDRAAAWGPAGRATAVMQALKDRFDPANVLNPGRFLFDA